jgi:HAD superfamily phosphatase
MSISSAMVIFDIDGVIRDVGNSYRRALADTVEHFTQGEYRPSQADIGFGITIGKPPRN